MQVIKINKTKGNIDRRNVVGIRGPRNRLNRHGAGFWESNAVSNKFGNLAVPFRVYKESISSCFAIEKIIEEFIGNETVCIRYKAKKDNNIYKNRIFKNCKQWDFIENEENAEKIFANENFVIKFALTYHDDFIIDVFLPNNKNVKKIQAWANKYLEIIKKEEEGNKTNINILKEENQSLKLVPIIKEFNFEKDNYNDDFENTHNEIVECLKKDKGIILLHGEPGTGKTSYIKCLPTFAEKTFIFIPPSFGEILVSPSFLSFMMNQKNSVLIIEDAESILKTRKGGQNHAVSNILNLTDGILAEMLGIQVICSLNCNINQIDEAILRPGRLLKEYSFGKLNLEKSNMLLKKYHKDKDYVTSTELTLAQIYNYESYIPKNNKIGFTR